MINDMLNPELLLLGQRLGTWAAAVVITLGVLIAVHIARFLSTYWLSRREDTRGIRRLLLSCIHRTHWFLALVVACYIGFRVLDIPAHVDTWFHSIAVIALVLQMALWANEAVTFWFQRYETLREGMDPSRVTTLRAVRVIIRLALAVLVVLLILDNIPGVEITALVASLGIGGIAVALALQNILGDLFASLSIVLDKPFVVGDFIIVDSFLGTVDNIGLKTTRIRSLSGEQLVFSNNDLLKSRIRNYKRMQERRVVFSLGVVYQTTAAQLEKIPSMIKEIITGLERTRFDRAHFSGYGDFSLQLEIVYYVLDPDYNLYMDIQQAINLMIFRRFEQEGISFAYPTRTLYLNSPENEREPHGYGSKAAATPQAAVNG